VALGTLIKQKPSFVLQLRKSGNTKQARKSYKLTEAGIRAVRNMISGSGGSE
jgi:DNA-binding PadR family transcriptional regulator